MRTLPRRRITAKSFNEACPEGQDEIANNGSPRPINRAFNEACPEGQDEIIERGVVT